MRAYVLMDVRAGEERSVVQMLRTIAGVVKVETTFGAYDVIAQVEAPDLTGLGRLVYDGIRATPGVIDTMTCLAVE
jgi:DNA-binding Lrp family transcriptional regulator